MSLMTLKRKPYQRFINSVVRTMNKQLAKDEFLCRHCNVTIRQEKAQFYRYEDGSSAGLKVLLRATDKVTGAQTLKWFSYRDFTWGGWYFWLWVNDFVLNLRKEGNW